MIIETILGGSLIANAALVYVINRTSTLAHKDGLTGLNNRRQFDHDFYKGHFRRKTDNNSLILIDVNDFKGINDTYGHQYGDEMLKKIADVLMVNTRSTDTVYRIGGDEFAIITNSLSVVRKLRRLNTDFSLSIGYATIDGHDKEEVFNEADRMLYESKRNK